MNSRERVLAALRCEEPDRVPYCETAVDRELAAKLLGWRETRGLSAADTATNIFTVAETIAVADFLHLDNLSYILRAPIFAERPVGKDGRRYYGQGLIHNRSDLAAMSLPDPSDDSIYDEAREFVRLKGDRSAWFLTRMGIFPTMLSMGLEDFSIALKEDWGFVEELLDRFCEWTVATAERVCAMGFDVFFTTDDMAFKTGPFFSPGVFRELLLPRYKRLAEKVSLPWVIHSDGNVLPFVDYLVDIGIAGLHPVEKGAMDIRGMKKRYGRRLCLFGNVDLNTLGIGTPEEVEAEVRGLIRDVAPGGGYVVTSGNSLAAYLRPENVIALSNAVRAFGKYPIAC